MLILAVFIGLRYKVGADWLQYYTYYNNVEDLSTIIFDSKNATYFYEHNWEPAFKFLCAMAKSSGISFEVLLLLITLFNLYSLDKFLRRYLSNDACIFLVLLLALNMLREFDVLRQSLAFYIMLFAYKYINKSFPKYLAICLLAATFHMSALIFLPIYPFFKLKVTRTLLVSVLVFFLLNLILKLKFLTMIITLIEKVIPSGITGVVLHQVRLYLVELPVYSNINLVTILYLLLLITLIVYFEKAKKMDSKFISVFVICIVVNVLFSEIGEIQSRFAYFFSIGPVYCLTRSIGFFGSYKRMLYVCTIIIYSNIKIVLPMRVEATKLTYTPYRNYLFYFTKDPAVEQEIMERHSKAAQLNSDFFNDNIKN